MNQDSADHGAMLRRIHDQLRDRQDPPEPWSHPSEVPWTEEEFSRDYARAAARDPETTDAELEQIVAITGLPLSPSRRESWRVLDLGCGDGRLLLPLARMGHAGVGIDLGPAPVETMLHRAEQHALPVEGVVGDLRDWAREEGEDDFDLALISFGTFGAMPASDGEALLRRCSETLRGQGWLYLDMGLSLGFAQELDGTQEWWTAVDFVLGDGPQLVLDDHAFDDETRVYVRRSFALSLDEFPRLGEVRQTSRLYESDELEALLARCGFETVERLGDFHGSAYDPEISENLVLFARRSG